MEINPYKRGDKVKVIDEDAEGIVIKTFGLFCFVDVEGFEFKYKFNQLTLNKPPSKIWVNDIDVIQKEKYDQKKKSKKHLQAQHKRVVDLHIHELVNSIKNMMNGEMLNLQLSKFDYELKKAIRKKESGVVFIHGVGEGVLKNEIRLRLDYHPGVSYLDGNYKEFGYGATEVVIHNH